MIIGDKVRFTENRSIVTVRSDPFATGSGILVRAVEGDKGNVFLTEDRLLRDLTVEWRGIYGATGERVIVATTAYLTKEEVPATDLIGYVRTEANTNEVRRLV